MRNRFFVVVSVALAACAAPVAPTGARAQAGAGVGFVAEASGTTAALRGVWGADASDVFAVGDGVVLRSSGDGAWSVAASAPLSFVDAWGVAPGDVLVAGYGGCQPGHDSSCSWETLRLDGGTPVPRVVATGSEPIPPRRIVGTGDGRVLLAGLGKVLASSDDGATWAPLATPRAVGDLVVAAGALVAGTFDGGAGTCCVGFAASRDGGASWTYAGADDGSAWGLMRVAAAPDGSVVALATPLAFDARYSVVRSDGSYAAAPGARTTSGEPDRNLYALAVDASGTVLVAGGGGALASSDDRGASWTLLPTGTTRTLRAAWVAPDGGAYVVGDGGVILHRPAP